MRVTIKDVAREARVSICTVSHVLNETPNYKVKPETRALIQEVAQRLHYRPNLLARGLVKQRSYLVGVLVNRVSASFLPETLQGIQNAADDLGYSVMLYTHMWNPERERKYLRTMLEKGVDGIIIQPMFPENVDLLQEVQATVPLVQLHTQLHGLDAPAVVADQVKVGRLATEHLIKLGHRRIAHIRGIGSHGDMRYQGYCEALAAHGIGLDPALVKGSTWAWETSLGMTQELLRQPSPPTALFACSDMVAWGAMRGARLAGGAVPGQLAVVGVDDCVVAPLMDVALTTVAQPREQSGQVAMTMLHRYIEQEAEHDVLLDVSLVVRESCGASGKRLQEPDGGVAR